MPKSVRSPLISVHSDAFSVRSAFISVRSLQFLVHKCLVVLIFSGARHHPWTKRDFVRHFRRIPFRI